MKISKNKKFIISNAKYQKQIQKHINDNLFISSNLDIPQLKKYLYENTSLINTPDDKGETILSYSIQRNKPDVSKFLISNFDNINLNYYDKNGKSYLHKAVLMKNYDIITELIERGINVNSQDSSGRTALHFAAMLGDSRAIKLLIVGNANVNICNNSGETALGIAKRNGNLRCINALLKKKNYTNLEIDCGDSNNNDKNINLLGNLDKDDNKRNHSVNLVYSNYSSTMNNNEICTTGLFSKRNNSKDNDKVCIDFLEDKAIDFGNDSSDIETNVVVPKEQIELSSYQGSPKNFTLKGSSSNANNNFNNGKIKEILHPNLNFENFINERSLQHITLSNENDNINLTEELNDNNDSFHVKLIDEINMNISSSVNNISITESFNDDRNDILIVQSKRNDITYAKSESTVKLNQYNIKHNFKLSPHMENVLSESSNMQTINNDMIIFLKEINMEKHAETLISNGFDDISLIIEQSKKGIGVTEKNLKEANVALIGDRARIIVHIDTAAGNYEFMNYNREKVFAVKKENDELDEWLSKIKMENYIENFVSNGYYTLDLLLMQMLSKQPLTEENLQFDLKIEKIGYRARIINKLKEDAIKYKERMIRTYGRRKKGNLSTVSTLVFEKKDYGASCQCIII